MSKVYKVLWNGSQSDWEFGKSQIWNEFVSANCTRVILEEPSKYYLSELPMPPQEEEWYDDDMEEVIFNMKSSYEGESSARAIKGGAESKEDLTIGRQESKVQSSDLNEGENYDKDAQRIKFQTPPRRNSQETRKSRSNDSRNRYLQEMKLWTDFQKEKERYLRQWSIDESNAFRILIECIGASGKAMVDEFRLAVGTSQRGLPKRIWNALLKINDHNAAYTAANIISKIISLRVLTGNLPIFCEQFDQHIRTFELKDKSLMSDGLKLGLFLQSLKESELPSQLKSAMEQFERQGIEYVDLRMRLLDEYSRMKVSYNKNRSSVKQVAMNAAVC